MEPKRRWLQIRTIDQPGVHASIRAMRRVADAYPDRVMIGEAYLPIDQLMAYYGADLTGFHLPFNFHLISTDWKPKAVASLIEAYEAALPVGRMAELGARQPRQISSREPGRTRAGPGRRHAAAYPERNADHLPGRGDWDGGHSHSAAPGAGPSWNATSQGFNLGRDPVRTPMPWSSEPHGGFTDGQPWLPLNADADVLNVSTQADDPRSMLSLYRALIRLRRDNDVLSIGDLRLLAATEHVLVYERRLGRQRVMVALNMTGQARSLKFRSRTLKKSYFRHISTIIAPSNAEEIHLRADEGRRPSRR